MAMKGKTGKSRQNPQRNEPSFLLIGALIFSLVLLGIFAKEAFFTSPDRRGSNTTNPTPLKRSDSVETLIQLVASDFRCACGKCGELPLIDCDCDMPRGAIEEKLYIREKLEQGLPAQKVIEMVDELYGHRMKT